MGKYDHLARYLADTGRELVSMTFDEISDVLGAPLPKSATLYPPFWFNPTVALPLMRAGFRARPRLIEGRVEFVNLLGSPSAIPDAPPKKRAEASVRPDFVLVGCVKTKLPGKHRARDLYRSTLFLGRRRYAESLGVPWFILSAKYGLLAPDDEVEAYDVALLDLSPSERVEWGERVLGQVDRRLGSLRGKTVEIHAGFEYRAYGVKLGLESRGAKVVVPLERASFGQQLAWYQTGGAPIELSRAEKHAPILRARRPENAANLVKVVTHDFFHGRLDLSERAGAPVPGWSAMPECVAVAELLVGGATPTDTSGIRELLNSVGHGLSL